MHRTLVALLALTAAAALLAARPDVSPVPKPQPLSPPSAALRVGVRPVASAPATQAERYSGVTRAADSAALGFTAPGRVVERPVKVGDRVEAGQLLARLDPAPLLNNRAAARARVSELRSQLAQARRDVARAERLRAKGAATPEELEQRRAAVQALQAGVRGAHVGAREAARLLAEAELRAPAPGTVAAVFAEPGEVLPAGQPVLALKDPAAVELVVEVAEPTVAHVRVGQRLPVAFPLAGALDLEATVAAVAQAPAGQAGLYPVRLTLPAGARPGWTAFAAIPVPVAADAVLPPEALVSASGAAPHVFAVRAGRAVRVPVRLGGLAPQGVLVRGALTAGEPVVVAGHVGLRDGRAVDAPKPHLAQR